MWRVDKRYRFLAAAVHLCPGTWDDDSFVADFFRLRGNKEKYVQTAVGRARCLVSGMRKQLAGE
eukprot:7304424-Pyramimonas_sp.AAC.1